MESKHKNALIGALLAVVFVMAVGYAAFAQQLTINGTAEITSKWDVHFNPGSDTVVYHNGRTNQDVANPTVDVDPTGSITYSNTPTDPLEATIAVHLVQSGDSVTFTLNPHNYGTGLNATGTMTVGEYEGSATAQTGESWTIEGSGRTPTAQISNKNSTTSAVTVQKGYIRFTITPTFAATLTPTNEDEIVVVAEYVSPDQNATDVVPTSAGITVKINYTQVA